jgi:hypothetical protein
LPRDWIGTLSVCSGVILLITVRGHVPQTLERREYAPVVASVAAGVVAVVVAVAWTTRRYPQIRTALVGTAAGVCFSVTAQFIVIATNDLAQGGVPGLVDWPIVGMASSGLVAAVLVQDAFSTGAFPTALTAMTVADPLASWVCGAVLFDESPPTGVITLSGLMFSGALIVAGAALLAGSPTLHDERRAAAAPQFRPAER